MEAKQVLDEVLAQERKIEHLRWHMDAHWQMYLRLRTARSELGRPPPPPAGLSRRAGQYNGHPKHFWQFETERVLL